MAATKETGGNSADSGVRAILESGEQHYRAILENLDKLRRQIRELERLQAPKEH
jgi:hypothetical protein